MIQNRRLLTYSVPFMMQSADDLLPSWGYTDYGAGDGIS